MPILVDGAFIFYFGQFWATNVAGVAWQRTVIFLMILQHCRKKNGTTKALQAPR